MLTRLHKQLWFVSLIIFMVGWSSVVMASGQLMHHQMKIQQNNLSSKAPLSALIQRPCHSLIQFDHQSHHLEKKHTQSADLSSRQHQTDDSPCLIMSEKDADYHAHDSSVAHQSNLNQQHHDVSSKHVQCNECAKSNCQTSNHIYVFTDHFDVLMQNSEYLSPQHYTADQAQNLRGFWQQILRPPKV